MEAKEDVPSPSMTGRPRADISCSWFAAAPREPETERHLHALLHALHTFEHEVKSPNVERDGWVKDVGARRIRHLYDFLAFQRAVLTNPRVVALLPPDQQIYRGFGYRSNHLSLGWLAALMHHAHRYLGTVTAFETESPIHIGNARRAITESNVTREWLRLLEVEAPRVLKQWGLPAPVGLLRVLDGGDGMLALTASTIRAYGLWNAAQRECAVLHLRNETAGETKTSADVQHMLTVLEGQCKSLRRIVYYLYHATRCLDLVHLKWQTVHGLELSFHKNTWRDTCKSTCPESSTDRRRQRRARQKKVPFTVPPMPEDGVLSNILPRGATRADQQWTLRAPVELVFYLGGLMLTEGHHRRAALCFDVCHQMGGNVAGFAERLDSLLTTLDNTKPDTMPRTLNELAQRHPDLFPCDAGTLPKPAPRAPEHFARWRLRTEADDE